MSTIRRICVFCGSRRGDEPHFAAAAEELGELMANRGLELVYGGARRGLMGLIADAVLARGGRVTGVIPHVLTGPEMVHQGLTTLHTVGTMHERKMVMADVSDAFIALPGGLGTLDELFETATWGQIGLHRKPYGILNTAGYFTKLIEFLEHAVREGFIAPEHRHMLRVAGTPGAMLEAILTAPSAPRLVTPRQALVSPDER